MQRYDILETRITEIYEYILGVTPINIHKSFEIFLWDGSLFDNSAHIFRKTDRIFMKILFTDESLEKCFR